MRLKPAAAALARRSGLVSGLQRVEHQIRLNRIRPDFIAGPPHFVGIGAQKAGTTWWHALVAAHPNVTLPITRSKELHYFDNLWGSVLDDGAIRDYHRLFSRPSGLISGEWTPRYMYDFWSLSCLKLAAPEVRLLILLRDPVDRFQSGLTHELYRHGRPSPTTVSECFNRGLYASQIERAFGVFPPHQVLVLQMEQCIADPGYWLKATYRFLGLPASHVPPDLHTPVGRSRISKVSLSTEVVDHLVRLYRSDVARLPDLVPNLDLTYWPRFSV